MRYNVQDMEDNFALYQSMLLIRRFEERLLVEFSAGKLTGTTHAYIGQEADAVGIFSVIDPEDVVFSNHRCHGHFLAYGGDPYPLAAELMGRTTGLVGGRGGSQHIYWRNFYSNGIQGGITPVATGMALAEKVRESGKITLVFIGDGTLGEGTLYESLNLAALWKIPILFVLEDNHYAQTTPVEKSVSGSMKGRFVCVRDPSVGNRVNRCIGDTGRGCGIGGGSPIRVWTRVFNPAHSPFRCAQQRRRSTFTRRTGPHSPV